MIITDIVVTMNEHQHPRSKLRPAFMALLIACMMVGFCTTVGSAESSDLDVFAKCVAEKKATMYGSFLCSHCDDQKKLFGPSFRYIPYVECSVRGSRQMSFPCIAAQIRYTPTWIFADDERRTGVQSLKELSTKMGCPLP